MALQRIGAALLVTLLACVVPLGAACDVACAFGGTPRCHSEDSGATVSSHPAVMMAGMNMDGRGMPMAGMPEDHSPASSASIFSPSSRAHPSLGEMGPCERRSCSDDASGPARASAKNASDVWLQSAAARLRVSLDSALADCSPPFTGDSSPRDAVPLVVSLRV